MTSVRIKTFAVAAVTALTLSVNAVQAAGTIETSAKQAILLDTTTGAVLFEKNADQPMPPSSMGKIMTVYKVFEHLKDGRLSLDDRFVVSEKAWRKQGSKMFVRVNSRVKVEDLIRGIVVQSGNDASIVVAEGLSGSEGAFAEELNRTAKELGMTNSHFVNSSGWPDPEHRTTARDLAKLSQATIENFPEYYHYYAEKAFTYSGIRQPNRNPALYRNIGSDGLKTGHTEEAGYGLAASAVRNGRRLILVVNGLPSKKARAIESERMFDWGFREFNNYALFKSGEAVADAEVWMGAVDNVPLVIKQDVLMTLSRKARRGMKVSVLYDGPFAAPVAEGTPLATLKIEAVGEDPVEYPLIAGSNVPRLGMFSRLGAALKFVLWGESG